MQGLLQALADERVTARFVRFLVAEGVIPGPRGGRSNAEYGLDHARGIRRYLELRDLGLSASRTREIIAGTVGEAIPVPLGPGLTLMIDRGKLGRSPGAEAIAGKIIEALHLVRPEDDHD